MARLSLSIPPPLFGMNRVPVVMALIYKNIGFIFIMVSEMFLKFLIH